MQLALAFYLINLQEFTIQTSLSIARDRVFGVLLGLMCMWLIYDRLWVKNALDEMQTVFARNLEMFAELAEQLLEKDQVQSNQANSPVTRSAQRRFSGSDGASRRGPIRVWSLASAKAADPRRCPAVAAFDPHAAAGASHLGAISFAQTAQQSTRAHRPGGGRVRKRHCPGDARHGERGKREACRCGAGYSPLRHTDAKAISNYYQGRGVPVSSGASDVVGLADSLATILAPLYEDIRDTYAAQHQALGGQVQLQPGQA